MPEVSVILPNYNHAPFLQQRIDSILNQTFQDFELIILDDCSNDQSKDIIELFRNHPKVKHIVFNERNSGNTFKQWQKGVELTSGKYVWIAESDDFANVDFLKETIAPLLVNDDIVLSYCRSMEVRGERKTLHKWGEQIEPGFWMNSVVMDGKEFIKKFLRFRNVIPNASAVVFKKEAIQEIGIETSMQFAGDWFIWNTLCSKGKISFIAKPLNFFRQHSQTTRSIKSFHKERIRIQEYVKAIKKANDLIHLKWDTFNHNYFWIFEEWPSRTKSRFRFWFPPYPISMLLSYYKYRLLRK